jgi:hypothetical protein
VKEILLIALLLSLPAICLAQEKVYTNDDLKKGPTPPPSSAQPGTVVVTPPPPAVPAPANRPANLNLPVQRQQNVTVHNSTPGAPAVKTPPKPYNPVGSIEQTIAAAFASVTLFMLLIVGVPFLIGLICLIDILRNEFTGHNKIIWFILVLFLPLVGSILYLFIGIDQKIRSGDAR